MLKIDNSDVPTRKIRTKVVWNTLGMSDAVRLYAVIYILTS